MNARNSFCVVLTLAATLLGRGGEARAQLAPPPAGISQPQPPMAVQLYGNMGLVNPYMNPYFTGAQGNANYMMSMYSQNQLNGGIGSGVISGTRPAPAATAAPSAKPQPSHPINEASPYLSGRTPGTRPAPQRRTAILPGDVSSSGISNTGGYYQRGPSISNGAGRYFNRTQPARAQNNGR